MNSIVKIGMAFLCMGSILMGTACSSKQNEKNTRMQNITTRNDSCQYLLIAHRGGIVENLYDEFDPRSIQAAIDSGYYMLEMDVRPTKDKQLILHHDGTLKRIYGVDKRPEDLTLDELKQLHATNGGYAPMSFEEGCKMCSGKIRFMIDVKPDIPEQWYCDEVKRIMQKYNLWDTACFIRNDVKPMFGKSMYGFRITEIPEMTERINKGENIAKEYYLFDHGNRLNGESVAWANKHGIKVCASINFTHYKFEDWHEAVQRDIQHLRKLGIIYYQIDSDFAKYLK